MNKLIQSSSQNIITFPPSSCEVPTRVMHAGRERTLSESRARYWILGGRRLAKNLTSSCVTCRKERQPPHSTLMGNFPTERVKVHSPPFSVTGVDLFGPFHLKYGRNTTSKALGAIFKCATSRAVRLEIVENASTEAFLQALRVSPSLLRQTSLHYQR